MRKKRILVLAAHLDDEILGVGGTIAKNATEGNEVYIHIIRDGIAERHVDPQAENGNKKEKVKRDAIKAAAVLGVPQKNISFGGYTLEEDFSNLHRLDRKPVSTHIEKVLNRVKPTEVYTHHAGDAHRDHGIVYEATMIATRPISAHYRGIERVLSYEVPSSTDQSFQSQSTVFVPNVYVNISESDLEKKIDAFRCYETEFKDGFHPRAPAKLRAKAETRGAEANTEFAEAFCLLREIIK
jgi:N-acetylglucosamine malate deacetylase 1